MVRRLTVAAFALGAMLGLSACDGGTAAGGTSGARSAGSPTTQQPATKGDLEDKTAIPAQLSGLPDGPITEVDVKLLGRYPTSRHYDEFYSVLEVTSTARGYLEVEYVMLDKDGNPLNTLPITSSVSVTGHQVIVTRVPRLPSREQGKIAKVQVRVDGSDAHAPVTLMQVKQASLKIGHSSSTGAPTVSGQYRVLGPTFRGNLDTVCVDDRGVVRADSTRIDVNTPSWTPFTAEMESAEETYRPTSCFVGY